MFYYDNVDKFSALADANRRKIVELLARKGPLTAGEIGSWFPVSPPAISQHLKVLREANLVLMEKRAQLHIYRLNPQAVMELETWAEQLTRQWYQRFDALDQVLRSEMQKKPYSIERSSMQTPTTRELTLIRTFDAPRELVFRAWTDPGLVAAWWGPQGFTNPVCEVDARPGGAILIHMRGPDGAVYPMTGRFEEVAPPERLVFTSAAFEGEPENIILENRNTVTFAALGKKTQVTLQVTVLRATPAAEGPLSGMEAGWSQSLEKLGELVRQLEK